MFSSEPDLSLHSHALSHATHVARGVCNGHLEIHVASISRQVVQLPACVEDSSRDAGRVACGIVGEESEVRSEEGVKRVIDSGTGGVESGGGGVRGGEGNEFLGTVAVQVE